MAVVTPFHEVQFPTDISYGATGGPEYSTDVVTVGSGGEQRNQNWDQARAKFQVGHGVKTQAQLDKLIAFFRARKGKVYGFRFKDWADYKAIGSTIGIGDGTTTAFQLVKVYTDAGGYTETRKIKKPILGTVKIYINGVTQSSGWSVDVTTGKVTFTSAPANGAVIKADFEFDVPVRFDTDYMPVSIQNWNVYSWDNIPVIEIKI